MNRTGILVLIVAALGVGAFFILKQGGEAPKTTLVGADREFAVPKDEVYKVFLADRKGNKTTLTREASGWMYNGKYPARPDAIASLLMAIDQIRMKFKPVDAAVPNMVSGLATDGIKVEVYGKKGDLLKAYYVGGATNDERGTYVILEGAQQPYVAELGAWEGNMRFRFNLSGDDWRDRTLFGSTVEEIAKISVEYPKQQDKSFRIDLQNGQKIQPFYELSPARQEAPKPGKIEAYASGFEKIIAASYNNAFLGRDSISQQIPFVVISMEEKTGRQSSVRLYPIYPETIVDTKSWTTTRPEGVTAYYVVTQDNDFMIIQNTIIEKLLWAYSFFYE